VPRPVALAGAGGRDRRPLLGWALRALASAAVLVAVAWAVGGDAVRDGTAVLSPGPLAAAVGLGLTWRALAATRWLLAARALGVPLVWPQAYAEYLRSELLNQVLPGAVLGDLDRARRHGQDVGMLAAARAVALERVVGQVVLLAAAGVALGFRPELLLRVAHGADARTVAVLALAAVVATTAGVLLCQPWRRGSGGVPGREAAARAAPAPRPARLVPVVAAALGLSIGVLACFVALFVVAAGATGPATPVDELVPTVLVVLLLAGVPLSVAGWGAREAGAALCFAAVGLSAADGVAAAVGYGLLSLVAALPGLVPLLLPRLRPGTPPVVLSRASAAPAPGPRRGSDP
jgi:uncharacterized membrane protein YbhN (UPF0104 family)